MAQQTINVGTAPDDGTGDPLRTSFTKCNDNFTELYLRDAPQCGRFEYVSATACKFAPYNGDRIKINGTIHAIPSAGIAGVANTGVFVNGTGASNLAASTTYYVYAFSNSGTITADFSTTTHTRSSTAGNVGTEIKSGDDTRSLIGLIRTNASSQFADAVANRLVLSWFNRRNISLFGASTAAAGTASVSFVELTSTARINFLTWQEEGVHLGLSGMAVCTTAAGTILFQIAVDGATVLPVNTQGTTAAANFQMSAGGAATLSGISEGYHYATPMGAVVSTAATFYVALAAMVRG